MEEVADLLAGRDVLAHARDKQEVLNHAEVLRYVDRHFLRQERPVTEETIYQRLVGRIAATDRLIDQIVYRLYGLAAAEADNKHPIAIVEGG